MKPLHATVLEHIRLGCLRLENNVEGERLQVAFCLVHLLIKMLTRMIMAMLMMMISHPYLAFSRELNDWIIVGFCLFLADRAHPEHQNVYDGHHHCQPQHHHLHHPHHPHLMTTLMLSPSTPPDSLPDSPISLLIDFANEPALPGLRIILWLFCFWWSFWWCWWFWWLHQGASTIRAENFMVVLDADHWAMVNGQVDIALLIDKSALPGLPGLWMSRWCQL